MTRSRKVPSEVQLEPAGSPQSGEPAFLLVGRFRRPHGVHGEIVMEILTDFPERIKQGKTLFVGENHEPHVIESSRKTTEGLLIHFSEFSTPEQVSVLRNFWVYVASTDAATLPEGAYYHHQLVGLKVIDKATGREIGTITEILETGADDVYIVGQSDGKELLLPAIESVVVAIDLSAKTMTINLQEWL